MSILVGALAIAIGTWLGAPIVTPIVVGIALGLLWPGRAARSAAVAAAAAWGGLLLLAAVRGDAIAALGDSLGAAMGLPGWALAMTTVCYPALLAASAAWLGQLVTPRRPVLTVAGGLPGRGPSNS